MVIRVVWLKWRGYEFVYMGVGLAAGTRDGWELTNPHYFVLGVQLECITSGCYKTNLFYF